MPNFNTALVSLAVYIMPNLKLVWLAVYMPNSNTGLSGLRIAQMPNFNTVLVGGVNAEL